MKVKNEYLGGEVIVGTGASVNAPGLPAGVTTIIICARDGDVYATINGNADPLTSPLHAADGTMRIYGPFDNIASLGIYADAAVYAHLTYEAERVP